MAGMTGARANALAMSASDWGLMGLPASAALMVAWLKRDSRARSAASQPRRIISLRNRASLTTTLMASTTVAAFC